MKRVKNTVSIDIPDDFNFRSTVWSHGWSELAPFALDEENWCLSYVFREGERAVSGLFMKIGDALGSIFRTRSIRHWLSVALGTSCGWTMNLPDFMMPFRRTKDWHG